MWYENDDGKQMIGRLAYRQEGDLWVAYYAAPDTMVDAWQLATINMGLVELSDSVRAMFMIMCQEAVSDIIEDVTGIRPEWPNAPTPAPEHEKSGRA